MGKFYFRRLSGKREFYFCRVRAAFPWPVLCQLPQRFRPDTSSIEQTCQVVEQESLYFWIMPHQRVYQPGTPMTFTPEEAFEMEVYAAMDDFGIDYSLARYAVAERAAVEAIVNFSVWCRGETAFVSWERST